jgi:4-amino-4-deoxy-L-arabinose transferase-like glycosyltransferase
MATPSASNDEPSLLTPGNPLRWGRGGVLALLGACLAIWLMAWDVHLTLGVPLGFLAVLVSALGVLDLVGSFDDRKAAGTTSLRALAVPLGATIASGLLTFVLLRIAVSGRLPVLAAAFVIPGVLIATVAALYQLGTALGPWATDELGAERPLHRRHGFWVVAAAIAVLVPTAGSHSLTDPWETHYGEVAREMLSRDDWISTWWAQEGWFFSKPVLNFWMQATAMGSLGVGFEPDKMLAAAQWGPTPRPEWAVRMPVVLLTTLALYLLYKGVARVFGRRAGLLGALVLLTMPQWSMLSHQTMADMPFVSALTCAMGLLLLGIHTPADEEARAWEITTPFGAFRVSAYHLVFGAILLTALPQAFYLASRNVDWISAKRGFHWHLDTFWSGSRGNCGLPGNDPCAQHRPAIQWLQPAYQGLSWLGVVGVLLWLNWGERRVSRLCFLAALYFAAIATLGKGPAGFLLPVLCAIAYVVVTGRWRELTRLEILSGSLILLCVALPWYVAMHVRHGPAFIDRLIFHDMWKRALTHVHDTNEGDDTSFRFYVWQLGYAFFPWTGLVPLALTWWARRPDDADRGRGDASVMLVMWFVFAFSLFTAMLTKFHHYVFPAVPPAAMLVGVLLDRMLAGPLAPEGGWREARGLYARVLALGLSPLPLLLGILCLLPGSLDGWRGDLGLLKPPQPVWAGLWLVLGAALAAWGAAPLVRGAAPPSSDAERYESRMLSGALVAGALLLVVVGRDIATRPEGDTVGDVRLLHLFTYNYRRPWPDSLDFSAAFTAFGVFAVALTFAAAAPRLRRAATVMMAGLGLAFGAFCLDDYFVQTSPHWGQRETIERYYKLRASADEPIVAYQMNWKGENFYTGNRIPAFVTAGEKFKAYMKDMQGRGKKVFFFTTEHSRVPGLRADLGNPSHVEILTDRRVDNKFTLVRVRFDD